MRQRHGGRETNGVEPVKAVAAPSPDRQLSIMLEFRRHLFMLTCKNACPLRERARQKKDAL